MIKNILFDLDGTLLPMNQDIFVEKFTEIFIEKCKENGHDHAPVVKGLITGIESLVKKNDGSSMNQELFWKVFTSITNIEMKEIEPMFTQFYEKEYFLVKEIVHYNPLVAECISYLKSKNYSLIVATSPVFPEIAIHNRMKWIGLNPEDFSYITTFENSRYAKPNLNYYTDLFNTLGLNPQECIMVGNDVIEDGIIEELGVDCYLITDFLVNRKNISYHTKWQGSFNDFYNMVKLSF